MLNAIIAPVIVFAIIVIVHEGGHFFMAKLTGMKVDEFGVFPKRRNIVLSSSHSSWRI